ncbi:MAG TPA: hypothetical protein IAA29_01735 [Candidatus Paenibacillus intestinavium]|nr:hypothetical protein [Candidatus Paenibacillus intestinavium]
MNINSKKAILLITSTIIIVALLVAIIYSIPSKSNNDFLSIEEITELRNEYPTYNNGPALVSSIPLSFQELIEGADSVIIAQVEEQLPNYEIILSVTSEAEKAIHKKNGSDQKEPFVQYKLSVDKVISGDSVDSEIMLAHNALLIGSEPELKPGMKLILGVVKGVGSHEGKYFYAKSGTYYIVNDSYVLSTFDDETSKLMSGGTLEKLISTIKTLRKNSSQN